MARLADNLAENQQKTPANVKPNVPDDAQQKRTCSSRSRCMKFFSTSGCPYGDACHFQHFDAQGSLAGTITNLLDMGMDQKRALLLNLLDPSLHVRGYKMKLCHNYSTLQGCKYGEHCHYAHTYAELRSKTSSAALYSSRNLPWPLFSDAFLPYQQATVSSASFSVSKSVLTPTDNLASSLYYGEPLPPGLSQDGANSNKESLAFWGSRNGPISSQTHTHTYPPPYTVSMDKSDKKASDRTDEADAIVKMASLPIDAAVAGFIIGRGGGHVRQLSKLTGSRFSVREDSGRDCKKRVIHVEGLPDQVECALKMVHLLIRAKHGLAS